MPATSQSVSFQILDKTALKTLKHEKQVDFDGKFEYTSILSIEFELSKVDILVYPNPASNYIVIENMGVGETVQILSANGQLVKSFQIENNNQQTAIDDLPSGTYFIKVNNQIKRLIISK